MYFELKRKKMISMIHSDVKRPKGQERNWTVARDPLLRKNLVRGTEWRNFQTRAKIAIELSTSFPGSPSPVTFRREA